MGGSGMSIGEDVVDRLGELSFDEGEQQRSGHPAFEEAVKREGTGRRRSLSANRHSSRDRSLSVKRKREGEREGLMQDTVGPYEGGEGEQEEEEEEVSPYDSDDDSPVDRGGGGGRRGHGRWNGRGDVLSPSSPPRRLLLRLSPHLLLRLRLHLLSSRHLPSSLFLSAPHPLSCHSSLLLFHVLLSS